MQQPLLAHVLPAQQGPPATPHLRHARAVEPVMVPHTVPGSVQAAPLLQQAWPVLPHSHRPATHVPASSVVGIVQAAVSATQRPEEQQPVPVHTLPAQQGLPARPHTLHVLLDVSQTLPASLHTLPGQQGSPAPPHFIHWLVPEQMVAGSLHVPPELLVAVRGQQAWPALPHAQVP
jgi:hypothetical protein